MNNQKTKAFTLVELIVVITILAILGTIAFISLQGYSKDSRDSVRISDMKKIETGLELELTKRGKLTQPDNKINITASGELIAYQGYAGETVLKNIGVYGGGKDPKDDTYYTLMINSNLTKYQILGYLENDSLLSNIKILNNSYSALLEERTSKTIGSSLGILMLTGSKQPAQTQNLDIDIVNTKNEYIAQLDDENIVIGEGIELYKLEKTIKYGKNGSCDDYLKNNLSARGDDGIYLVSLEGNDLFSVYCDMTSDDGGWTLAVTTNKDSKLFGNNNKDVNEWYKSGVIGILPKNNVEIYGNLDFKSDSYSKININNTRICLKDNNHCYNFNHNKGITLFDFFDKNIEYTEASYNNVEDNFVNKRTYRKNLINIYEENLGGYKVTKFKCGWLGINKLSNNYFNNGSIGFIGDNDSNCLVDSPFLYNLDNSGFGVGINTCGDGSTTLGSECGPGGINSISGNQLNLFKNGIAYNNLGAWAIWVK